jgi:hypothetical protein
MRLVGTVKVPAGVGVVGGAEVGGELIVLLGTWLGVVGVAGGVGLGFSLLLLLSAVTTAKAMPITRTSPTIASRMGSHQARLGSGGCHCEVASGSRGGRPVGTFAFPLQRSLGRAVDGGMIDVESGACGRRTVVASPDHEGVLRGTT